MAKIKAKTKTRVKRSQGPVKAGSSMSRNVGGIVNVKVVATSRKIKNG